MVRKTSRGESFEKAGFNVEGRSIACYNFHPVSGAEPPRQLGGNDFFVSGVGIVLGGVSSSLESRKLQADYRAIPGASDDAVLPEPGTLKKVVERWQSGKTGAKSPLSDYRARVFHEISIESVGGGADHVLHAGFAYIDDGDRVTPGFFTSRIIDLHLGNHALNETYSYYRNAHGRTPAGKVLANAFPANAPQIRKQNLDDITLDFVADHLMQAEWQTISTEESLGNIAILSKDLILQQAPDATAA